MFKDKAKSTYKIFERDSRRLVLEYPASGLIGANLAFEDLQKADLSQVDLTGADLQRAELRRSTLNFSRLCKANLNRATFYRANLEGTNLAEANLSETDLTKVDLSRANLTQADLSHANLSEATFFDTQFDAVNLSGALLTRTIFIKCPTLADAKGLAEVRHGGPSSIDHETLRSCINRLPNEFLSGVGYTHTEVDYLRSLYSKAVYLSCFLSHGNPDSGFADRVYKDLRNRDVSCWHYNYDLKMGKRIDPQIREEIQLRDKLLVVCSKESLTRFAVVKEILEAIKLEDQTNETKLFPIRLDGHILTQEFRDFHDEMVEKGEWARPWLGRVLSYWIGDFSDWQNPSSYNKKLDELIQQLKKPEPRSSA